MSPRNLKVPSSTGTVPRVDLKQPLKHINHSSQTRCLKTGDLIQFYGHHMVWDEHCVSEDVVIKQAPPLLQRVL
ncbi:hypothetical protein E1B28_000763 [Marasmius oreades]|uniref:Uncharacterized protein n=1 Tax=Marasmius oreades TaxID=181124 RepID=A0A9P7V1Z8_9AGAR|nr:uncharacterized protein E1B28_000763 [Marasmius oreades]KAG7098860.1 hypothetical protein E1B28_000763 [Marasmius oreades]